MITRKANIIVGTSGGTSGKGSRSYKLSLPTSWVDNMGLKSSRELELYFDGTQIIIRKPESLSEFAARLKSLGHDLRVFRYYDQETLCTVICADFTDRVLRIENCTDKIVKTAFGKVKSPSWDDFSAFLDERCIPRARAGLRHYLEALGLEDYDPIEIIKKTAGRMSEDAQWLEMEVL